MDNAELVRICTLLRAGANMSRPCDARGRRGRGKIFHVISDRSSIGFVGPAEFVQFMPWSDGSWRLRPQLIATCCMNTSREQEG